MVLEEEQRLEIIQNLLSQKYEAEHKMRERSASFTKWILGLGMALIWILLTKSGFAGWQKLFVSLFVLSFSGVSIWFLSEICKGFRNNRDIVVKLEELLELYEPGVYMKDKPLFPAEYTRAHTNGIPSHFKSLYGLIGILALFLMVLILAR